ncbi:hypothetical protein ACIF85_02305 [Streptomyces sp. NPDC086033]|uniref:hypothetical protein n=1 Tax=Streptomyces sp. NPDC086033 TaxID=3365747 RepID=UPI0037D95A2F
MRQHHVGRREVVPPPPEEFRKRRTADVDVDPSAAPGGARSDALSSGWFLVTIVPYGCVVRERVTTPRARLHGPAARGAVCVAAALRAGGYGIPAVREVMDSLDGRDGLEDARRILRGRLDQLAARSVALLRAGADLAAVVTAVDATRGTPGPPE